MLAFFHMRILSVILVSASRHATVIRDFKNPGRGGSETRPEVTFPVSDEERMCLAFSPALENAA